MSVKLRLQEYQGVLHLLNTAPNKIAPDGYVKVYLGDGYFVDMAVGRAKAFIATRVQTLEQQLSKIMETQGLNEEGLPIMEITEDLDEDGNVVNARVQHAAASQDAVKKLQQALYNMKAKDAQEEQARKGTEAAERPSDASAGSAPTQAERIVELPVATPSEPSPESSQRAPAPSSTDSGVDEYLDETVNGISRRDMLELQLMNQELVDDMDQVALEDGELLEDDEMLDEDSDEDEFGRTRGALFPQDARTQKILEQLAQQRQSEERGPGKRKKSVSFDTSLKVHEFESSPEERRHALSQTPPLPERKENGKPNEPKVSRFMQNRDSTKPQEQNGHAVSAQVQETVPAVSDTVLERPVAPSKPDFYSRRYNPANKNRTAVPIHAPKTQREIPPEFVQHTNDVDASIQDSAMQYYDQASLPDEEFLKLHDNGDVMEDSEPTATSSDAPVMSNISERTSPEAPTPNEDDIDMKQVRSDYQKLRQKMIYKSGGFTKTDKEQETERVDEHGNPVKMSRFKAARTGMR